MIQRRNLTIKPPKAPAMSHRCRLAVLAVLLMTLAACENPAATQPPAPPPAANMPSDPIARLERLGVRLHLPSGVRIGSGGRYGRVHPVHFRDEDLDLLTALPDLEELSI